MPISSITFSMSFYPALPSEPFDQTESVQELIDTLEEGLLVINQEGRVCEFNTAAMSILHLPSDALLDFDLLTPSLSFYGSDEQLLDARDIPAMITIRTGHSIREFVLGIKMKGREVQWLKINTLPHPSLLSGRSSKSIMIFSDITESRVLKHELITQEQKFKQVFDYSSDGMITLDAHLQILEVNREFATLMGCTPQDLFQTPIQSLIHPEDGALFKSPGDPLQGLGYMKDEKFRLNLKGDEILWVSITVIPVRKRAHDLPYYICRVRDLTAEVDLKATLRTKEEQLSHAFKMSALGEMASGIAHEINNPLAIIQTACHLVRRKIETGESGGALLKIDQIETTTERIHRIVKGLSLFARESSRDVMECVPISRIIADTLSICQDRFRQHSIDLRIKIEGEPLINSRPGQISQVLLNLLNNAFDAIQQLPTPWVEISAHAIEDAAILSVTDSGNGIPRSIADQMMNPFFTTKESGRGTGLGLSISRRIISEHGGALRYSPTPVHTRFLVELPLASHSSSNSISNLKH